MSENKKTKIGIASILERRNDNLEEKTAVSLILSSRPSPFELIIIGEKTVVSVEANERTKEFT